MEESKRPNIEDSAAKRPKYEPLITGCRSADLYRKLNKISEGTYGVVYRAQDVETDEIVALKQIKLVNPKEGFPQTSLREIQILLRLDHPNIVDVREVVVGPTSRHIFMAMEYMEHELQKLLDEMPQPFKPPEVKTLMKQLLSALEYMHSRWVSHRDVKTQNLLFSNRGYLKLCDFGLARPFGDPLQRYTSNVVTLWYRSPELILGEKIYDPKAVDVWSAGCVFGEILTRKPFFNGKTEVEQLQKIYTIVGVPTESTWPDYSSLPNFARFPTFKLCLPKWNETLHRQTPAGIELIQGLLCCDPIQRFTAKQGLQSRWFTETPAALNEMMMPTFKDTNSQIRRQAKRSYVIPKAKQRK